MGEGGQLGDQQGMNVSGPLRFWAKERMGGGGLAGYEPEWIKSSRFWAKGRGGRLGISLAKALLPTDPRPSTDTHPLVGSGVKVFCRTLTLFLLKFFLPNWICFAGIPDGIRPDAGGSGGWVSCALRYCLFTFVYCCLFTVCFFTFLFLKTIAKRDVQSGGDGIHDATGRIPDGGGGLLPDDVLQSRRGGRRWRRLFSAAGAKFLRGRQRFVVADATNVDEFAEFDQRASNGAPHSGPGQGQGSSANQGGVQAGGNTPAVQYMMYGAATGAPYYMPMSAEVGLVNVFFVWVVGRGAKVVVGQGSDVW